MMDFKIGQLVYSKAGRDRGHFLVVIGFSDKGVLVCDGKERPLERPKCKNPKHLGATKTVLDSGSMSTNRALRQGIRNCQDVM